MNAGNITEIGVTFYKAGGHKHDGVTSSLIDTTKYSIFDFDLSVSTGGTDVNRESRRQNNRARFDQYITKFVSSQVLEPAGIVLPANSVRGVDIGANEISANNIRANTITANEIAANTITANEIAANTITASEIISELILVNNTIRSNNFTYNANTGVGTGWAIYGNGSAIFVDGVFSGKIDIGGNDATSFHVDTAGNMWSGNGVYANGKFKVSSLGDVAISGNLSVSGQSIIFSPANGGSLMNLTGGLTATGGISAVQLNSDGASYAKQRIAIVDNFGTYFSVVGGAWPVINPGATVMELIRTGISQNIVPGQSVVRPSSYINQIIQVWNNAEPVQTGIDAVSGIACYVGTTSVSGAVLRAFPAAGGTAGQAILGLNANGTVIVGTAGSGNGFDVGNMLGDGYGYMGASAFVVRSSQIWKDNVEYLSADSRDISVGRIRSLKPARWDDKGGFVEGYLSNKFIDINNRWVSKGKTPLRMQKHHYEFREHDCSIDKCIGDKDNPCPNTLWHKKRYGFVAEDVAEAFPKAVQFDPYNNPIGIDYSVIAYGLVETTQHLLDKIDELENKIAELSATG